MSRPISSLPDVAARVVVALPPLAEADGEAVARALKRSAAANVDPFDAEILSRLLAIGFMDARAEGVGLDATLGLDRVELQAISGIIEHPAVAVAALGAGAPEIDEEEDQVRSLLAQFVANGSDMPRWLSSMVARRAMRPNHLWQDLGLADRTWLNELLRRYFPALHAGNTADMKWKKYFYRRLCELEGFTLCTAPSCRECCDFERCFGAEDGQSLLARARLSAETADATARLSDS